MAAKRISATARKEVRDFASDAVPRSLGADITISTPDFKSACQKAKAALADARKRWEEGGKPKRGPLYNDMIVAAVTAEVMCAFAAA
jgi:hypothetical protein